MNRLTDHRRAVGFCCPVFNKKGEAKFTDEMQESFKIILRPGKGETIFSFHVRITLLD